MRIVMSNIIWDFNNKNVLVVGSSRGIGKGVVDEFNKSGANDIERSIKKPITPQKPLSNQQTS